jgi:NAD(P)-dependent dehydrogenase (short-subunit alcohol dehydrogenase family)
MLASQGWYVIGVGRDAGRCAAAEAAIRASAADGGAIDFVRADFDRMAEVLRCAAEIRAKTSRIDVLINNAGGVRDRRVVTTEGNEATFASNHLAPFLLTRELLPLLQQTAQGRPGAARVIAVSSSAHRMTPGFDWDDLQLLGRADFNAGVAYCQAKLANILFTRELARRLVGTGVVAQAMHPGIVDSNFASHGDEHLQATMRSRELQPPEVPARTLVWLATAAEAGVDAGRYFFDMREEEPAPQALDDEAARRLWSESEKLLDALTA